jgi:hypothetical protein
MDPVPTDWLNANQATGTTTSAALAFFDSLPAVVLAEMTGRWRGSELHTGHPMDGLLEAFGWWGKSFIDADTVHPLLFTDASGRITPMHSRFLATRLMTRLPADSPMMPALRTAWPLARALLRTQNPTARLRMMEHRGRLSAAMIYDFLPIHDIFRGVDQNTLLGVMDMRGMLLPFFFVLRRG